MLHRSILALAKRPALASSSSSVPSGRIYTMASSQAPPNTAQLSTSASMSTSANSSTTPSTTPMEDTIRSKLTTSLRPSSLKIHNDSHLHSHHSAMRGNTSPETHFRVLITSDLFAGKTQPQRHRMIYALLGEEMKREGGIHALQLKTRTVEEDLRAERREEEGAKVEEGAIAE